PIRKRWPISRTSRSSLARFYAQDLDRWRRGQDFAEAVHPVAGLCRGAAAATAQLVKLLQLGELDLELQGGAAVRARQRHQQPGLQTTRTRRFHLALNEFERAMAVYGQDVIREPSKKHRNTPRASPAPRRCD